jgi:hypothetical protein
LALAVDDPYRLRDLLDQGEPVTAHALIAAAQSKTFSEDEKDVNNLFKLTEESLALLLATGVDPNLRLDSADDALAGVAEGWADNTPSDQRDFVRSWKEMYPLYWTGMRHSIRLRREKDHLGVLETLLLAHGADPYALFRQPLRPRQPFLDFPGTVEPKPPVVDEEWDCSGVEYFEFKESSEVFKYDAHRINKDAAAIAGAKERGEEYDEDDDGYADTYPFPPWKPKEYGVRSLLHAMLEDGAYMRPLLDLPNLDIEHRDPQGRTLFLSACRSFLGADAAIDGCLHEVYWNPREGLWSHNPFPQQPSRLDSLSVTAEKITIAQYFIDKGANLLAVDNYGKHAIFQLLESTPSGRWISFVSHSLNLIVESAPQLINQRDNAGNSPLHAAMRRLRRSAKHSYKGNFSELYDVVHHLLANGADPQALDELGNTALHYLADEALVRANSSENHALLFRKLVDLGADIHVRNNAGESAPQLFLAGEARGRWQIDRPLADAYELFEYKGVEPILSDLKGTHDTIEHGETEKSKTPCNEK